MAGSPSTPADLPVMFRNGLEGVKQRGKAQLNDKTMIDALRAGSRSAGGLPSAAGDTVRGMRLAMPSPPSESGMKHTVELEAQQGPRQLSRSALHRTPRSRRNQHVLSDPNLPR